jgi:prepilin-type N-terminal cleavage/methylation domain-containing protein
MRSKLKHRVTRAFTLIEILIVVVILSILAAIVLPQFSNAADSARDVSVHMNLFRTRNQIALYQFKHPLVVLTPANLFSELVDGDFLQQSPRNPLQDLATATAVGAVAGVSVGWVWDGEDLFATDGTGQLFDEDGDGLPG